MLTRSELLTYLDAQGIQTFVTALLDTAGVGATVYFMDSSELERAAEKLREHPGIADVARAEANRRPVLQVTFNRQT
jgi:exopolysaccharide biosynthesis predicted pyruvyltransferase EpsI